MTVEIKWGGFVKWGADQAAWGRTVAGFIPDNAILAHALSATYPDGTVIAAWTGLGDITLGGTTYTAVGPNLVRVEAFQNSLTSGQGSLRVVLSAVSPEHLSLFITDPGQVMVTVKFLVSTDGGQNFVELPRSVTGELSRPTLQGGQYSIEVASYIDSLDRGYEQVWSQESQERDYPGDLGLEHLRSLSAGVDIRWP